MKVSCAVEISLEIEMQTVPNNLKFKTIKKAPEYSASHLSQPQPTLLH
jgi:hypothetical protein